VNLAIESGCSLAISPTQPAPTQKQRLYFLSCKRLTRPVKPEKFLLAASAQIQAKIAVFLIPLFSALIANIDANQKPVHLV
jgi:hypothetical protein